MKKIIFNTVAIVAVFLFSFTTMSEKNSARVNRVNGLYVFTDSEPQSDFKTLGTVVFKGTFSSSPQYTEVRDVLIDRGKKQYPNANGIILSLVAGDKDHGELIQITE